ncbi:NAD(+) diphosphatase [Antrihabitans cavernicola]|uniref:NAD(+) diphosphatase n=1 Tax=Antrihabitans cavernicola TaxID=2495913 RepID=A0A5A7SD09_9NOCA|nr:NAD(+) diphosphatase [Spelaeibacter cavernicola]KAA0024040.1 NAD(+) diphosphatase [Spelaeibacter cavernicola]
MANFELSEIPSLSRSTLDRAEDLRADEQALKQGWTNAALLRVNRRGQVRIDGSTLVLDAATDLAAEPAEDAVFLGVDNGRHVWAVRTDDLEGTTGDLRASGSDLDDTSAGMLTTAVALLNWHASANFSSIDGSPTRPTKAGWSRISESTGHEEFPRSDPAVICLVHDGAERVLLARQHTWPETMFSILAGFVEAGESMEACVAREIKEEVGLDVHDIRYLGSQPWPFPRSLMIGFAAVGDPEQTIEFTDGEIAEAHWFTRAEVREALAQGDWTSKSGVRLLLPGSISIARGLVTAWAASD